MVKIYAADTNVLLQAPYALESFPCNCSHRTAARMRTHRADALQFRTSC